jgi:hypothetical protein
MGLTILVNLLMQCMAENTLSFLDIYRPNNIANKLNSQIFTIGSNENISEFFDNL